MEHTVHNLTDDDLLVALQSLLQKEREALADVLMHLNEVEARRLYLGRASSMFVYCTRELGMSEDAAFRRIRCARLVRRFPVVLEAISDGRLHLAGATVLAPHIDEDNCDEMVEAAAGLTKRKIEELVADLDPQPDAPSRVRALPSAAPAKDRPGPALFEARESAAQDPPEVQSTPRPSPKSPPARMQPLGERRYKIQFTASEQTHHRLRQAQELLRHTVPNGEIAEVIDRALALLVETTQRKRFGVGASKRRGRESTGSGRGRSRHIPNDVKREVIERDGYQCTHVGEDGQRCAEEGMLELHHREPFARGGRHSVDNVTVLCRAHNQHEGRLEFGDPPPTRPGAPVRVDG